MDKKSLYKISSLEQITLHLEMISELLDLNCMVTVKISVLSRLFLVLTEDYPFLYTVTRATLMRQR